MLTQSSEAAIVYELVSEHANGETLSYFYQERNVHKSRRQALQDFLRTHFAEQQDVLLTLFVRHLPTFQRVELLNSMMYESTERFWECSRGLEKELVLYEKEKLATFIAIVNSERPESIEIFWPRGNHHQLWKTRIHHFILAADYWCFLGLKQEEYLPY